MTTTDRNLEMFGWLPIARWTVDNLTGPQLGAETMCKVCDKYQPTAKIKSHVKMHVKDRAAMIERKRKEALKAAQEARRLKREAAKAYA